MKTSRFLFSTGPFNTLFLPQTSLKRGKCITRRGKFLEFSARRSIEKSEKRDKTYLKSYKFGSLKKWVLDEFYRCKYNFPKTLKSQFEKKYHFIVNLGWLIIEDLIKLDQSNLLRSSRPHWCCGSVGGGGFVDNFSAALASYSKRLFVSSLKSWFGKLKIRSRILDPWKIVFVHHGRISKEPLEF